MLIKNPLQELTRALIASQNRSAARQHHRRDNGTTTAKYERHGGRSYQPGRCLSHPQPLALAQDFIKCRHDVQTLASRFEAAAHLAVPLREALS